MTEQPPRVTLPPVLRPPSEVLDKDDLLGWFRRTLIAGREQRGVPRAAPNLAHRRDSLVSSDQDLVVPHILATYSGGPALLWEQLPTSHAVVIFEASRPAIERWAGRPNHLRALARMAPITMTGDSAHLSFRWVLANELAVARLTCAGALDHVSLHFGDPEVRVVADLLEGGLGLLEISRPESIPTPGRWFVSASALVHLSTRATDGTKAGTGSTPNHVCFAVPDLAATVDYLDSRGLQYEARGSLSITQLWLRWSNGQTFEIQGS